MNDDLIWPFRIIMVAIGALLLLAVVGPFVVESYS